jgi:hypothetical protein
MGSLLALPLLRSEEPEIIPYNGKIWTADEAQPRAQAVAISGARFLAVGSNDDVLRLATGRTRKIDLGLKAVLHGASRRWRTRIERVCKCPSLRRS